MSPIQRNDFWRARRAGLGMAAVLIFLAAILAVPGVGFARDELTLRVNDAIGEPGGLVALVVRTYASRPVGQGQVCFRATSAGAGSGDGTGPFASVEGYEVFSKAGDALGLVGLEVAENGQVVLLQFTSDSGSINQIGGPLAVIHLRLRGDLRQGQRFRVRIDPRETLVFDKQGDPVAIEGRSGDLRVRGPAAAFRVEAEGDKVVPGEVAELGVETFEPFAIGSGQVGLRYDASVARGRPRVRMDKRHGARRFSVDRSIPGLVVVSFVSRKGTLNTVPGQIVEVRLPTSAGTPIGDRSRVSLDPSLTWLLDPDGAALPLKLKMDFLEFETD